MSAQTKYAAMSRRAAMTAAALAAMATPMTPERFQDRWEAFKGEPQQVSGIWGLYSSIGSAGSGPLPSTFS